MMRALELAKRLNAMIAADTRPLEMRNRFSRRSGRKRTQIESVRAIPAETAGALPIRKQTQGPVANMGNSAWGSFSTDPLTADAINQGNLADCYLLIAMYLVARLRPNFFDDIFVKIDDHTAIVQWFYAGYIIQVRTSLLISTDYDHPANADVRPELAEKTWCLIRSGISDYAKDNFGLIENVFYALGLDGSYGALDSAAIIAAMQAGKAVGLQTTPTATGRNAVEDWIAGHAYGVIGFDAATKQLTLAQPWHAAREIPGVDAATISGGKVFNLVHVGAFPAAPRILASMVDVASERAAAVSAPATAAIPVPATGAVLQPEQNATLSNCRLENQGGKVDIGYITGAAYAEYPLAVASAGDYALSIDMACVTAGSLDIAVNGVVVAAGVTVPNTSAWSIFHPVAANVKLPAGAVTLRLSNRVGAQYNIGAISIAPAEVVADDPIVAISVVTTRRSGAVSPTAVV